MGVLREVVFDCRHPASLARFWVEVLDGFAIRSYDEAEMARLAERGLDPESDPNVMVDGPGLKLCFQRTEAPTPVKNRLHLDAETADRVQCVKRLCTLGASVVEQFEHHIWMRDPEGNDFCLTDSP